MNIFFSSNMLNINNLAYILCLIISIILSIIIGTQGKKRSSRFFALTVLVMSFWIFSNFMVSNTTSQESILFWIRTAMIGPVFIGPFFLIFSLLFPEEKPINFKKALLILVPTLFFLPFIYTKYNVVYVTPNPNPGHSVSFTPGILYPILGLFLLIYISTSFLVLVNKYRKYENITIKKQLKFVLFGFIVTFFISLMGTLVLPMMGYTVLGIVGPLSTILFSSTTFFIIYRYKFLNIRVLLGKLFYHILIATPPYLTFFILAYIYERVFGTSLNTVAYVMGVPIAILFTASLNLFTKFISEYTDTHLINPGYNPLVVLEQHRQRLSNTLDIEKIVIETLFIIARTIRPSTSGIILTGKENNDLWLSINYKKTPYDNPREFKTFTEYFSQRTERVVNYEELSNARILEDSVLMQNRHLSSQMEKYNLGLIVVIKEEATIKGLLLIGKKEANEPYNSQEIKFLISLADSMSMALGRALLHKETQQFNEDLKRKVTEATSDLQKKNEALEEALGQLEEIRRQEKDMIDVMGHELRTPISITRNALLTLQKHLEVNKEGINPEKVKKYTNMAVEGARREIALVETLLSTTKLEGGRMQVDITSVSLDEVIKYSLRSHNELAKKNNTEVIYNTSIEDIVVLADKIRIQEIMDNFLNNAIKYTGQGKVEISMYKEDKLGWIDVKDSGIGISEENLKNLGKKFFRAQNLYNQSANVVNPSGTGLGLFVSFLLIEMMKGEKRIISKEGEGSVFSFGLPLYIDPK